MNQMEKKVAYYTVVHGLELSDLESDVQSLIENDWQPLGGISCSMVHAGLSGKQTLHCQAMVKYEFIPQSYTVESEIEVEIPKDSDWNLALATSEKIKEMGLTSKTVTMKQLRYIKECIIQGKEVTLADVTSIK